MNRALALAVALLAAKTTQAQISYNDSRELIKSGVELYDNGYYKKAISHFQQVHECDTNYSLAVYEEILALQADSVYEEARNLALAGLKLPNSNKREYLLLLAASYDYLHKRDSAHLIYDSLIAKHPYYHQPWYEKGVVYLRQEKYDLAVQSFQRSLLLNPNHFRSHYMLGTAYAMQGRLSEAFIALEASLLMTQNAKLAADVATLLTQITEGTDEMVKYYKNRKEENGHPLFDEIDQLVVSKLALDKKYKLKINLNENIFRQSQVIMEKLKYDAADTNFVMQYYVPLLTDLFKGDMFEGYMLLLFSGYNYENVNTLAEKKHSEVADVKGIVFPYLNKIQSTGELNLAKRKTAAGKYHFYSSDNVMVVGTAVEKGKETTLIGDASIYRGNHTLLSRGKYDNEGKKDGPWVYYFSNGRISSKEKFVHGEQRDSSIYYLSDGKLSRVNLRNEKGDITLQYDYDRSGYLSKIIKKNADKSLETQSFHPNGAKRSVVVYEDNGDLKDGSYVIYHSNGKVKQEFSTKNGKNQGAFKTYYINGKPNEEANYDKGVLEGRYAAYYQSGQLKEKSNYSDGKADGPFEEYYENGKLSEKGSYSKGTKSEVNQYTRSGRLYGVSEMRNGVPTSLRFTNDDNMVVYKKSDRGGLYEYTLYHPNGNKLADMRLNAKGNTSGLITYYHTNGNRSDEVNYLDGKANGRSTSYYRDGKILGDENYKDGERDGYFKSYYRNGKLYKEGWYKEGKRQGLWKTYFANGNVKYEVYNLNDEYDGHFKEYNVGGVLSNKYIHDMGTLIAQVCYDTTGVLRDSVCFNNSKTLYKFTHWPSTTAFQDAEYTVKYGKAEGKAISKYLNGAVREEKYYTYGEKDSMSTSYHPDGTVCTKGLYQNGNKTGKWATYNEAGELIQECDYANDQEEGKTKTYAGNTLRTEHNNRNGKRDGQQIYYGEDGRVALILVYNDGDVVSYTHEGKDGKLLPETKIKNGKATVAAYYSNGQKSAETVVDQGLIKGALKIYFSNGQLAEERNLDCENLEGPIKRYNPDGKLIYDAVYKEDVAHGTEKVYDKNGNLIITANYYYGEKHGATVVTNPTTSKTKTYNYKYGELISVE